VDLFPPRRRAIPLTDLDEVGVSRTILRFWCFVLISVTMKLVLSSIDVNIHVYTKLAGRDVTYGNYAKR